MILCPLMQTDKAKKVIRIIAFVCSVSFFEKKIYYCELRSQFHKTKQNCIFRQKMPSNFANNSFCPKPHALNNIKDKLPHQAQSFCLVCQMQCDKNCFSFFCVHKNLDWIYPTFLELQKIIIKQTWYSF